MAFKYPLATRRGMVTGLSALSLALSSVAPASLEQQRSLDPASLESLREIAVRAQEQIAAAEAERAATAERTREQLSTLNARLEAAFAQNQTLMTMLGQVLATQADSDRVQAEIENATDHRTALADANQAIVTEDGNALESTLANKSGELAELLNRLPADAVGLKAWSEEDIVSVRDEITRVKEELDKALDEYVEKEIIPALEQSCVSATPDVRRQIVTAVRSDNGGQDINAILEQFRCQEAPDLVRKLSNARSVEEAQAAFQSSMQSLMIAAMMSGNPYLAAIAAVLMLLTSLFSDGNGDGDGDGMDDQPGGGPVAGREPADSDRPQVSSSPARDSDPVAPPQREEQNNEDPVPARDEFDTRTDDEIGVAGGDSRVRAHPGVGCSYALVEGPEEKLTLARPEDNLVAFDLSITGLRGSDSYKSFPKSWTDDRLRLISCDFNEKSVIIQFVVEDDPLCLRIGPGDGEGVMEVRDAGFSAEPNGLCGESQR